jgi:hypothetical protein
LTKAAESNRMRAQGRVNAKRRGTE